jgi:hypothetical protein
MIATAVRYGEEAVVEKREQDKRIAIGDRGREHALRD